MRVRLEQVVNDEDGADHDDEQEAKMPMALTPGGHTLVNGTYNRYARIQVTQSMTPGNTSVMTVARDAPVLVAKCFNFGRGRAHRLESNIDYQNG